MKKKQSGPIPQSWGDVSFFLEAITQQLEELGITTATYELDHICFRVEDEADYNAKKNELENYGSLISEALINGRPISTFKLSEPIVFRGRKIELVELPAPKPGHPYKSGFEHVEFVVDEGLKNFTKRYKDIPFDTKNINKAINADVTLKLASFTVKFHEQSLEKIIELEKNISAKS